MSWEPRAHPGSVVYSERYAFNADPLNAGGTTGLRVLKLFPHGTWAIRWGDTTEDRHCMPPDTPLEEVQAVAITLWRMK